MKRIVLFLATVFLSFSCGKNGPNGSTVKYEFSSNISATYKIEYSSDISNLQTETFQGTTWSKTVIVKRDPAFANITIARLVAYPPSTWANTTNSAHVNLKMLVNGKEEANTDTLMTSKSVDIGIFAIYTF